MAGLDRVPPRLSRALGLVVALLAAGLILTGCVPSWFVFGPPVSTSTPTGEKVAPALEPYYQQILSWRSCGQGAECATAKAPLDWSQPERGEDIELALVRLRATGERQGSLFTNPGGPGGSGVQFVKGDPDFVVSPRVREHYDLVGWDPRGVGESTPVRCEDDAGLDEYFFGAAEYENNTPEGDAELVAAARAFAAACAANTGKLLDHIDTESTTRDLDMLRAVLGDSTLHYLGYSYGSDIGATYAELFPQRVGRMVLDGATDSTIGGFETGLAQLKGFTRSLYSYLDACGRQPDCFFHGGHAEGVAFLQRLFDRLDDSLVLTADGREVDASFLYTAIQTGLYDKNTWSYITQAVTEIDKGDPTTAVLLTDFSYSRNEDGSYADNSQVAFLAIMCIDYPVVTDPAEIARQNALIAEASPFRLDQSRLGDVQCQNWPYSAHPRPAVLRGAGAAPILVVATTGDPATPYEWGVALAKQLESAHLITYEGEGHIAYDEGDPCVRKAVDDYLISGTLPPDGLICSAGSGR